MISPDTLKPGDIILLDGNSWVSRQIKKVMRLYRKVLKKPAKQAYSHSATVIKVWNELAIGESQVKGYVIRPIPSYYLRLNRVMVLTPRKPYTSAQQNRISREATKLAFNPTRYDFIALLHQLVYVLTGKWIGKKGTDATKRMYCTEASAYLANTIRPSTFKSPYATNPLDIELNHNYVIKYD